MTRTILEELLVLAQQHGDGLYGNLETALADIDAILSAEDLSEKHDDIRLLIAPTSNLQDLSIDCHWGDQFFSLADKIESEIKKKP